MEWLYNQPVKIDFGINKVKELGNILKSQGYKNGFIVSDPIFIKTGLINDILGYSDGVIKDYFYNLTPNPSVYQVDECASLIRKADYDVIIALGGGSSLDCAKAAAAVSMDKYDTKSYHSEGRKLPENALPIIAIPTTAGTGSEVTCVAVLTDQSKNLKAPLVSDNFFPKIAIIDPILTLSVPKQVIATTGLDVLSHALEGYWSKNHQPICDAMAIYASDLVFKNLIKAYDETKNIEAREKMCEASVIAGLAFTLPKTAGVHACSFPLTTLYGMSHGEACAFTLDSFTRINAEAESRRLHSLATKCGFNDAYHMADEILNMKKYMKMKITLSDANIKNEELDNLSKLSQHPNMKNNPVEMSQEMIKQMYSNLI